MKQIYILAILLMITKLSFSQEIGAPAPNFTLINTENVEFKLSEQKGKVVVVFIFGYACSSCKAISPDVRTRIVDQFKSNEDFLMIGIDAWDGTTAQVNNFVNSTNLGIEVLQKGSEVPKLWGTTYDRLVIIDREGYLVFKGVGLVSNHINQAITVLETTLNETKTTVFNIENANENEISIFPNPVIDEVAVGFNLTEKQKVDIVVYNLNGKAIFRNVINANIGSHLVSLKTSDLKSGIHFLQLKTNKAILTKRFIVK